jgi:hypothetical protein
VSNELKRIVKDIQFKTDKTIGQIAADIGYARAYFTNQVNIGTNKKLKELLLKKYPNINEQIVLSEDHSNSIADKNGSAMLIEIKTASGKTIKVNSQADISLLNAFFEERDRVIDELQTDKKQLQNTIDTNLTALMQLLSALSRHDRAFHDTILRSLARLEGKKEVDLVAEARSSEAARQIEEMKDYKNDENRM